MDMNDTVKRIKKVKVDLNNYIEIIKSSQFGSTKQTLNITLLLYDLTFMTKSSKFKKRLAKILLGSKFKCMDKIQHISYQLIYLFIS